MEIDAGVNTWQKRFLERFRGNYALAGVPLYTANDMTVNTDEFVSLVTPYP